jgi:hypothetical protein
MDEHVALVIVQEEEINLSEFGKAGSRYEDLLS